MDCILKSFMDTVTLMIVDIVGIFGPSVRSCEKITVKELRPSTSSPFILCL